MLCRLIHDVLRCLVGRPFVVAAACLGGVPQVLTPPNAEQKLGGDHKGSPHFISDTI